MRKQCCLMTLPAALLLTAGCASKPVPIADLTRAHTLVAEAQQSDAPRYDSVDLVAAQDKLQQADSQAHEHPVAAGQLAQEASADAQLALARSRANEAQESLNQVNASLAALRTQSEPDEQQAGPPAPGEAPPAPGSQTGPQP